MIEQRSDVLATVGDGATHRVGDRAEEHHLAAVDEPLQEDIEDLAVKVGDAAQQHRHRRFVAQRLRQRDIRGKALNGGVRGNRVAIAAAHRQHRAAGRRDSHALIQLLNRALDVIGRLEHGVAVENELDIRVELARLSLDGGRLANRLLPLNRQELEAVLLTKRPGADDRSVRAAVVHQNHASWAQRLTEKAGEAQHDCLRLVESRNDHVDPRLPPVLAGRGGGAIGALRQARQAQRRVRSENEIWENGHV